MILINQNAETTVIIIKAECFYFPIQKNHCETQGRQYTKR